MRGTLPCLALLWGCASGGQFPGDGGDEDLADGGGGALLPDAPAPSLPDAPAPSPPDAPAPPDAAPPDARPCVEGNTNGVFEGRCYMLFTGGASWTNAAAGCESVGAHLATIANLGENGFIDGLIGSRHSWIGATDKDSEGVWTWINGEPWSYTIWDGDQPDDGGGGEDCGELRGDDGGRWNDDQCGNGKSYVCERE